jgi:hypothetical protein
MFPYEELEASAHPVNHSEAVETHYFDESFRYCADIECWTRIALATRWRFEGLAASLTLCWVVDGRLSSNTTRMFEYWCRVRDKPSSYASAETDTYAAADRRH